MTEKELVKQIEGLIDKFNSENEGVLSDIDLMYNEQHQINLTHFTVHPSLHAQVAIKIKHQ